MNTKVNLIRLGSVSKETKGLWGTRIESSGYPILSHGVRCYCITGKSNS